MLRDSYFRRAYTDVLSDLDLYAHMYPHVSVFTASHGRAIQTFVLMAWSETPAFLILPRARPEARGNRSLRIV